MRFRLVLIAIALCAAFALGRFTAERGSPSVPAARTAAVHRPPVPTHASPGTQPRTSSTPVDLKGNEPIASFETLMFAQPYMLADALKQLRQPTANEPNLYAIGFAGDGDENVFRNEIDYLPRLLSDRFGAAGHTLQLINSPYTYTTEPLATRTNLMNAIESVALRMHRDDDILLLFLTSHGSRDHELVVKMGDMPFDQVTPDFLRHELDKSDIRWRVIVISACYSGGFIPALREPHTMIITAARADRTSFGCGSDSQITWFGKAFLTQALNHTTDFHAAWLEASKTIAEWEKRDHETPSEPQFWEGPLIEAKLATWRATLPADAPAVTFAPAPNAARSHRSVR